MTTIRVPLADGAIAEPRATICGSFAVHRSIPHQDGWLHSDDAWSLTHIATGRVARKYRTRRAALAAAAAVEPLLDWSRVVDSHSITRDDAHRILPVLREYDDRKAKGYW